MTDYSLADEVLPFIRTTAQVWRWNIADDHGEQMHEAIDTLEQNAHRVDAREAFFVAHQALADAIEVIAGADDSTGVIGDACERLLELHPRYAAEAQVPAMDLVKWMISFQFEGEVDYFDIDPVAYAPALGESGMVLYRKALCLVEDRVSAAQVSKDQESSASHSKGVLQWNARRLAVLDRDIEKIIQTHARDYQVAAWVEETAQAFEEIGRIDLAIEWAQRATTYTPDHQAQHAAEYWCELLTTHRPDDLVVAREEIFERWPSSSTAHQLYVAAGNDWSKIQERVMSVLATSPRDVVLFTLDTLKDPSSAWEMASSLSLEDSEAWRHLVAEYQKVDPLAALPVHRRLVEEALVETSVREYQYAAARLAQMRRLAVGCGQVETVDSFIAELRQRYRIRPRMQKEFDRAGLP